MKRTITLFTLALCSTTAMSQNQIYFTHIDQNSSKGQINNNGTFFNNPGTGLAAYEVPKGAGVKAIYFMNVIALGRDVNNQLHGAVSDYENSDFFPGPITADYNDSVYQAGYEHSIWVVTREEINDHLANWNTQGYIPASSIANWPGNGDVTQNQAHILAPFVDMNGDEAYNPLDGDYPLIRGDKSVYCILNDSRNIHPSGTQPIGMEVHLEFYQYESDDYELDFTTFIHATVFNRGTQSIYDFQLGSFVDFDLGSYTDDYIGTMGNDLAYVYNGDLFDEANAGVLGYGEMPPAVGVLALSDSLYSHVRVTEPLPATGTEHYNVLQGLSPAGAAFLDNNGQPTRYMYSSSGFSGWNEVTENNPSGDRRSHVSFPPQSLLPGSALCYDYAVIYGYSNAGAIFDCVDSLGAVADYIRNFYQDGGFDCDPQFAGISEVQPLSLAAFPNPANDILTVTGAENAAYAILTTDGKIVQSGVLNGASLVIDQLKEGYYLLQVDLHGATGTVHFMKQ